VLAALHLLLELEELLSMALLVPQVGMMAQVSLSQLVWELALVSVLQFHQLVAVLV
jgi:hypothetical protein